MTEPATTGNVRRRFPPWLKKRLSLGGKVAEVHGVLADLRLATVCQGAHCPNLHECFHAGTATFMILGDSCTRDCRFCAVRQEGARPLEDDEPERVAEAAARLGLRHVVVTSVTRDDLPDGGAMHFRRTALAIRARLEKVAIEVLTPDFQGDMQAVDCVLSARPDVFNHNVETVPRLYPRVRPQADYGRSLGVLRRAADRAGVAVKSGIMVGLGETAEELRAVMRDLAAAGCGLLTIGQYLQPSPDRLPVERFVPPEEFDQYREEGLRLGFGAVASGPFVRSSYHAGAILESFGTQRRPQ